MAPRSPSPERWDGGAKRRSRSRSQSPRRESRRDAERGRRSPDSPRNQRRRSRSRSRDRRRERRPRSRSPPRSRPARSISPPRRRYRRSPSPDRAYGRHQGRGGPGLPQHEELPPVSSIHHARVVSVRPFGAFVELDGFRRQGLVHHTQVAEDVRFTREDDDAARVHAMEFFLPPGERVWVKVQAHAPGPGPGQTRLSCSTRAVSQEDGTDLDPEGRLLSVPGGGGTGGGGQGGAPQSDLPPELDSVHRGTVQSIRPFGVFVQLEGFRKYALVHSSQISDHLFFGKEDTDEDKVREMGEVLAVGEAVWVKIVEVGEDERGPRVSASIKLVSQRDGTDLDPNGLKYKPRGAGGGPMQGKAPIGAAAATTHDAVVDWGHLGADVVQYGGQDKRYDMVREEERPLPRGAGVRASAAGPARAGQDGPVAPGSGSNGAAALAPRGRGRGNVLPAWMTGESKVPGSAPSTSTPREGGGISSIEDALAVLERLGGKHGKRDKKHKKDKSDKKDKKDKKHKKDKR
ncbi:hypothetical protein ACKKBF_B18930 [Auxenochlorella protothecoides x Auxenochlorella symbiontica]